MPPRRRAPKEPFRERFPEYGKRIAVEDGIAAKSRRGDIGESWWSGRFLAVLQELGVGGRLDRGKTYARAGQVIDLAIEPGEVVATVQGSRAEPYRARIGITTFADEAWEAVEEAFARDSWYAASLLGGTVPDDLEDVFAAVGLSLFPTGAREMPMDCSCPDWSVPCKHLAAVAYLVAERFDDDPFLILRWRGRDRATLLAGLRDRRDDVGPAVTPLADVLDRFWTAGGPLPEVGGPVSNSEELLDQMPPLGVALDGVDARELLRPLYRRFGA
ncbi:SWIM zinc finger family protein [Actinomycetospora termitidis]|uniref:SWIM zinc finger family protein n=1 Tax=Actinomycetospora termitidis TaxID=3053470 RepID=A0ABT7MF62_9PSEU|nr:SWIM zinc finger family protein [Actinomycetospora sp. Odt1-22]MDL5158008.1 SWIM zinc finger family protein [Actinomycetospora sp. Odt1-22]